MPETRLQQSHASMSLPLSPLREASTIRNMCLYKHNHEPCCCCSSCLGWKILAVDCVADLALRGTTLMERVRLSLLLNCDGARFSLAGAIGKRGNTSLASACAFSQGLLAELPCSSVSFDAWNIRRWPLIASLLEREMLHELLEF